MGRGRIAKADGVDIVFVIWYPKDRLSGLYIINNDGLVAGAGDDLSAVSGESQRPDLEPFSIHSSSVFQRFGNTHTKMGTSTTTPTTLTGKVQ